MLLGAVSSARSSLYTGLLSHGELSFDLAFSGQVSPPL